MPTPNGRRTNGIWHHKLSHAQRPTSLEGSPNPSADPGGSGACEKDPRGRLPATRTSPSERAAAARPGSAPPHSAGRKPAHGWRKGRLVADVDCGRLHVVDAVQHADGVAVHRGGQRVLGCHGRKSPPPRRISYAGCFAQVSGDATGFGRRELPDRGGARNAPSPARLDRESEQTELGGLDELGVRTGLASLDQRRSDR